MDYKALRLNIIDKKQNNENQRFSSVKILKDKEKFQHGKERIINRKTEKISKKTR